MTDNIYKYMSYNGEVVDGKIPLLSHMSMGFQFGYGVFETILIDGGNPIFFSHHCQRLFAALDFIELKHKLSENILEKWVKDLIKVANGSHEKFALKIMVYQGVQSVDVVIVIREFVYHEAMIDKGYNLTMAESRRHSQNSLLTIKSMNYLNNILLKSKLKDADDMVFINENDKITESLFSNIFLVKDNSIYTPRKDQGLLDGIIRKKVVEIVDDLGYKLIEDEIHVSQLESFDEVFLTNSLMGVMYVNKIDKIKYHDRKVSNQIRKTLLECYRKG